MEFNDFKNEILRRIKEADAHRGEYSRAYQANDYAGLMRVIKDNFDFAVQHRVIDPFLIETYIDQFTANQIYCNVNVTAGFLLAWDDATVEAWGNATVRAWDDATVRAWGNATVEAWGDAYITSYWTLGCKLRGNAIYRIRESNTIRYASDTIHFEKVPAHEPDGVPSRLWEGWTESGIKVHCFIPRIAIDKDETRISEFEKELQETRIPSPELECYPGKLIL